MPDILCIGWVSIDFIGYVPRVPAAAEHALAHDMDAACGGRAASQAMAVSALEGRAALLARIGTDPHAELLEHELEELEVDLSMLAKAPAPTGIRLVAQPDAGVHSVVAYPGANEFLTADDINRNSAGFADARVVLVTAEAPGSVALRALELARQGGAHGVLTHIAGAELSDRVLAASDIVVVSAATARGLLDPELAATRTEHAARVLLQRGARCVVLAAGQSVLVATAQGLRAVPSPGSIDDEDSIDAFVGGLACGLAEGEDVPTAVGRGTRAAGMLVGD